MLWSRTLVATACLFFFAASASADVTPGDIYHLDCDSWLADGQAAMAPQAKKANDAITRYLLATGFALGHFQAELGDTDMSIEQMQGMGRELISACRANPQQKYTDAVRGIVAAP